MKCPLDGEGCNRGACPYWVHGGCLMESVDLKGHPDLAMWLVELRRELLENRKQQPIHAVQ